MFIINTFSTCFGHHYAHLQENKTCVTARGVLPATNHTQQNQRSLPVHILRNVGENSEYLGSTTGTTTTKEAEGIEVRTGTLKKPNGDKTLARPMVWQGVV